MNINEFRLKLEFSIEEINDIFKFLETIPYGQVAGIIENFKQQIDSQLVPAESFDDFDKTRETPTMTINTDYPV